MENDEVRNNDYLMERDEWFESLDEVLGRTSPERVQALLGDLVRHAHSRGVRMPFSANTPYINTIPVAEQPPYPGDTEIEQRIENMIRWNAMAMVMRANKEEDGIGGHIASYASVATLFEVGLNHFFRAPSADHPGDLVFFQGHSSPGIYARAFLEGRFSERDLQAFRRELDRAPGLSSYPHPWLMPDFWQFPTVSMGLGPIMSIYMARFSKYLEDRGLKPVSDQKIWTFVGDGESDEPETLGAINLAAREHLDNLVFVLNANLQRLDGPVRGNGKVIQELEASFAGAGWNVIKVIWGSDWDPLLAADKHGRLVQRMGEVIDGQYQKYSVEGGDYFRKDFFGSDPALLEMVKGLSDKTLHGLRRGGHDRIKVYAAYKRAMAVKGKPTVIIAKTIKGFGMGGGGEGHNVTHQQKKLGNEHLREFRTRFSIPIGDEKIDEVPFYRPPAESAEMRYLLEKREKLGGFLPARHPVKPQLPPLEDEVFDEFFAGTNGREVSTTMAFTMMLGRMLRHPAYGKLVVPIVPDEARTFGMDALFRQIGIYAHMGQLYEPVDRANLLYYREAKDGQILEEGITEAGSMCSFIASGTSYATQGVVTLPFFTYYSMFGIQRVGDLFWAAADSRVRGFVMAATAGRTTLSGEGLQHQDGNSHLLALTIPNMMAYDPAYAYELATIIQEGTRRMCVNGEDVFYYITIMNENYAQPAMPQGCKEGILRGLYRVARHAAKGRPLVHLLGSGTILNEVLKAAVTLHEKYNLAVEVWSATSYKALQRDALETERWNRLHPGQKPRRSYIEECLGDKAAAVVAASDYVKALPATVSRFVPGRFMALGTDGFGRSDGRRALRRFFEVDAEHVVAATLSTLAQEGKVEAEVAAKVIAESGIDTEVADPVSR